jgi:hypothetical protein
MAAAAGGFKHTVEAIGAGVGLCLTSESTLVSVVGASLRVLTAADGAASSRATLVAPPAGAAFTAIASAAFSR